MSRVVAATVALLLACTSIVPAQSADSARAQPGEKLFVASDLALLGGFTGLTIALFPIDESAARRLQRDPVQNRRLYTNTATFFRILGAPVTMYASVGMYGVGRLAKQRRLADFGLHVTEAILLGGLITGAGKGFTGRARPRYFYDTLGVLPFEPDPRDFEFFRGFGNGVFQSFPSGHTTAAFAWASALTSEMHRWKPQWTWWVGPILYGSATLVGISRMYNNAHWASDVAAGAAVGTFAGLKVVRYNHAHPNNRFNRLFLAPDDRGAKIGWSRSW